MIRWQFFSRPFYSCSQHLSRAAAKLSELGHRREAVKIMLKLAAIKRTFAEDSITPEERHDNLLEVRHVHRRETQATQAHHFKYACVGFWMLMWMFSRRKMRACEARTMSVCHIFLINWSLKHIFFLQAYDILKEAASLSDAVLHDVQSVSTLSEVCCLFCWLQTSK